MHRDPTGRYVIEPEDLYEHHEHVYELSMTQAPPEVCHRVESYVCKSPGCGSSRNEWPDTGEFIRTERDERGEWVLTSRMWRHFAYLEEVAAFYAEQTRIYQALGIPHNIKATAAIARDGHPPQSGRLN